VNTEEGERREGGKKETLGGHSKNIKKEKRRYVSRSISNRINIEVN